MGERIPQIISRVPVIGDLSCLSLQKRDSCHVTGCGKRMSHGVTS